MFMFQLNATILYIHPMSKAVVLSCLPYIVNYDGVPRNQFSDISRGMIFPEAAVKKVNKKGKKGVYFKLDKLTGFASVSLHHWYVSAQKYKRIIKFLFAGSLRSVVVKLLAF